MDALPAPAVMDWPLPDGTTLPLVRVPAGEFFMGSDAGLPLERPVHRVRVVRAFLLGQYPLTQRHWRAVRPANPSEFVGDNHPVDSVSWDDAAAFCLALSETSGRAVRLPSEAEWEYACRAGTASEYTCGDGEGGPEGAPANLGEFAWFDLNAGGRSHAVGLKRPNAWGLHDMAGQVWEWCADVWHDDYHGAPTDGGAWAAGADCQPRRCLRGGAWNYDAFRCRSAYRSREWKHFSTNHFGLRVAVDL